LQHRVEILYTWRPSAFSRRLWEYHLHSLPLDCRRYILRFHRPEDRQDRLLARLLVRKILTSLGYGPDCLEHIRLDHYWRPFISREIDFNLSHSGNLIICAASTTCRVGIDIEKITSVNFSDTLPLLPAAEQRIICSATDPLQKFFELWTARESILKADGRGLAAADNKLQLLFDKRPVNSNPFYPVKLGLPPAYSGHIAANSMGINVHVSEISTHEL
jgi:4'-phosphopantetheinyl transferase